jgi:hypothetical protein
MLPSSYPGRLASRNSTLLSRLLFCTAEHFLITTLHGPHRKHSLYCWRGVLVAPLPSSRRPIVARVISRENVFTESLPSNGYTRHIILCIPSKSRAAEEMNKRAILPYIPYECHLALARSATAETRAKHCSSLTGQSRVQVSYKCEQSCVSFQTRDGNICMNGQLLKYKRSRHESQFAVLEQKWFMC